MEMVTFKCGEGGTPEWVNEPVPLPASAPLPLGS